MKKKMSRSIRAALLVLVAGAVLAGCGGPSGRIRSQDEESLVGARRAGAPTFRNLIDGAMKKLVQKYRDQTRNQAAVSRIKMAYVGVDNRMHEELGAWRDQINSIIDELVNRSGDFMDISFENFVLPAMKAAGLTTHQLVLPANQRKLAAVLEQNGKPVDYLLFAKLSQGNTRAGDLKQSDYLLSLELVNISNGTRIVVSQEISKEYRR